MLAQIHQLFLLCDNSSLTSIYSVTPLKANFMHTPGIKGEIKL